MVITKFIISIESIILITLIKAPFNMLISITQSN
jgi:hypothetical protein